MTRPEVCGFLGRLIVALPLLTGLAWTLEDTLAYPLLLPFRSILEVATSAMGWSHLYIAAQDSHHRFVGEVVASGASSVNGTRQPDGAAFRAAVPLYIALVPLIVLAVAALTWQGLTWRGHLVRLVISVPLVLILQLIDTPLVLAISLYESISSVDPLLVGISSWGEYWVRFLDCGGRYALAIGAAILAAEIQLKLKFVRKD